MKRRQRRPPSLLQQSTKLGAIRRCGLYALVAALAATGAAWLWLRVGRADDALPSPLEPWMMKLHGAAAMLLIYLSGTMLFGHMVNAWRRGHNHGSGAIAAATLLLLGLSGYGLYYFGGDSLRRGTEWLHWGAGFALPLLLAWHVRRGRRAVARASRNEPLLPPL
ncbi:MAG: hypothetical protein ABI330_10870 [Caldimonas sp.]|nr:hypothetical protein [Pseudomonadota bacterium]